MPVNDATAGWLFIAAATIWAGKGIGALIASRRRPAKAGRGERAQKWQSLTLAVLLATLGIRSITYSPARRGTSWWLYAGTGALVIWMLITDVVPWLRSRLKSTTKTS
jgi:hypothetical protein